MLVALSAALAALVLLPLLPALHEALSRRDTAALPLSDRYAEDLRERLGPHGAPAHPASCLDVAGSLDAPDGSAYGIVRVRGDARLGAGVCVAEVLSVGGALTAGAGSELLGTADAGVRADLGAGTRFERVHAPVVQAAGEAPPPAPWRAHVAVAPAGTTAGGRTLVHGDLDVLPDGLVEGSLVVRGVLTLGAGARVAGSVKAQRGLVLGAGASVGGHAFSDRGLTLGDHAAVGGVACAEGALVVGRGATVGTADVMATASGRTVVLAAGARVYGTVWAAEHGVVAG